MEEGATHVLVLASRPEDYMPKTKPGIYETGIAPLYFNSHGQRKVSEFFEKGGQQYLYAEDLMLLQEAKHPTTDGVLVPPPEILYGVERTKEVSLNIRDRKERWNKAHLFPLRVPKGYKELEVLDQNKDAVLEAVRDGFMTAFDSLSDIVGLEGYQGKAVAELVFPSSSDDAGKTSSSPQSSASASLPSSLTPTEEEILRNRLRVPGEPIPYYGGLFGRGSHDERDTKKQDEVMKEHRAEGICLDEEEFSASTLLECLPGFQDGRFGHLAKGLREQQQQQQHDQQHQEERRFRNSAEYVR